ncbi:hypothetical protein [Sulfuracidifex tepidarius]|uniref:Uncharacterized protein n=1 Tax=Sulfuracidifex tepidarius TaxID=1294262 RepID=A0A510E0X7_9CREN|nr:hypothetical protein [Sulfuracidifex tepidarius]BBG23392.1 hypothetical protein IC006_0676 [Sulfuracidifex tepidarius]BBG26145.1 hypothetical protein IC007_0650 [Sulfuracidifex tepidarius]
MSYYGQDGYAAVGGLRGQPAIFFPVTYDYGNYKYVIQTNGYFSDGNGVNPSFAIEGTYTATPPFNNTGWDAMYVSGVAVTDINAVAGHSSATGVGGNSPIPSYYAESGLTLFHEHNSFLNLWGYPYAWYFSIGTPSSYSGLNYKQLSEGQSYDTINGLNYAVNWISP